jgi:hypothetical protein
VLQAVTKSIVISNGVSSDVLGKEDLVRKKYLTKNNIT